MDLTSSQNLDPQAVQLAKAIRQVETNGRFTASNADADGWSVGAYQWHGKDEAGARQHFQAEASQFGLDPHDFSPVNQDKVAYAKIKSWKDQGYHADEIAALWNGARMVNGRPTAINPHYVEKVKSAFGAPAPGATPSQPGQPSQPVQTPPGIGNLSAPAQPGQPLPGIGNLPQDKTPPPTSTTPTTPPSVPKILGNAALTAASEITGAKGVGESLASGIIPHLKEFKAAQAGQMAADQSDVKLLQEIRKRKAAGKDTSRLEALYTQHTGQPPAFDYNQINPAAKKSNAQAIGEVAQLGGTVLAAGNYEPAAIDIKGGQLTSLLKGKGIEDTVLKSGELAKGLNKPTLVKLAETAIKTGSPKVKTALKLAAMAEAVTHPKQVANLMGHLIDLVKMGE